MAGLLGVPRPEVLLRSTTALPEKIVSRLSGYKAIGRCSQFIMFLLTAWPQHNPKRCCRGCAGKTGGIPCYGTPSRSDRSSSPKEVEVELQAVPFIEGLRLLRVFSCCIFRCTGAGGTTPTTCYQQRTKQMGPPFHSHNSLWLPLFDWVTSYI